MLLDEVQAVCAALSITQWEAWFGTEILGCMPGEALEETAGLAAFMATVFGGLAPRLANTVAAIGVFFLPVEGRCLHGTRRLKSRSRVGEDG